MSEKVKELRKLSKEKAEVKKNLKILLKGIIRLFVTTAVVYFLWNHVLTDVTSVNSISFWEAMGLRVLVNAFLFNVNNNTYKLKEHFVKED